MIILWENIKANRKKDWKTMAKCYQSLSLGGGLWQSLHFPMFKLSTLSRYYTLIKHTSLHIQCLLGWKFKSHYCSGFLRPQCFLCI